MIPIQRCERGRIERLPAEADSIHAAVACCSHEVDRDVEGIGFKRNLGARVCYNRVGEDCKKLSDTIGPQMRRGASAEIKRVQHESLPDPREFSCECLKVAIDQVVAAGNERKIAVAAAVAAEWHVDIGGVRRQYHVFARAFSQPDMQPSIEHVGKPFGNDPPDTVVGVPR